jgi:hypothetical protein
MKYYYITNMEIEMINIGAADRAIRFAIGFVLLLVSLLSMFADFFTGWGVWRVVAAIIGLVLVGTATFRICPAYMLLGIRTSEIRKP